MIPGLLRLKKDLSLSLNFLPCKMGAEVLSPDRFVTK